jgi:hypothetical protein
MSVAENWNWIVGREQGKDTMGLIRSAPKNIPAFLTPSLGLNGRLGESAPTNS